MGSGVNVIAEPTPGWQAERFACDGCGAVVQFTWRDKRTKVLRVIRLDSTGLWHAQARCQVCGEPHLFRQEREEDPMEVNADVIYEALHALVLCTVCGSAHVAAKMWQTPLGPLCPECVSKDAADAS